MLYAYQETRNRKEHSANITAPRHLFKPYPDTTNSHIGFHKVTMAPTKRSPAKRIRRYTRVGFRRYSVTLPTRISDAIPNVPTGLGGAHESSVIACVPHPVWQLRQAGVTVRLGDMFCRKVLKFSVGDVLDKLRPESAEKLKELHEYNRNCFTVNEFQEEIKAITEQDPAIKAALTAAKKSGAVLAPGKRRRELVRAIYETAKIAGTLRMWHNRFAHATI